MPSITIYLSKADAELVKQARNELKISLSGLFAKALRKKMAAAASKKAVAV